MEGKTVGLMYYNKGTMEKLRVKELREIARSRGLKGWYRLRKSDLISFIMSEERRQQRELEAQQAAQNEKRQAKSE